MDGIAGVLPTQGPKIPPLDDLVNILVVTLDLSSIVHLEPNKSMSYLKVVDRYSPVPKLTMSVTDSSATAACACYKLI